MTAIYEKNGYKLRDFVIVKWANNRQVLGKILKFNDDDTVLLELMLTEKKSDIMQRMQKDFSFEDILPREDFKMQYGVGGDTNTEEKNN